MSKTTERILPDIVKDLDMFLVKTGFRGCNEPVCSIRECQSEFEISRPEFLMALIHCSKMGNRAASDWWNTFTSWGYITDVQKRNGALTGMLMVRVIDDDLEKYYDESTDSQLDGE